MTDVLTLLQDAIQQRKIVTFDQDSKTVKFDLRDVPDSTPIALHKNFTLGQIYWYLKYKDKKRSDYVKSSKKDGFEPIPQQDIEKIDSTLLPSGTTLDCSLFKAIRSGEKRKATDALPEEPAQKKLKLDVDVSFQESKDKFVQFIDSFAHGKQEGDEEKMDEFVSLLEHDKQETSKLFKNEVPILHTTGKNLNHLHILETMAQILKEDTHRKSTQQQQQHDTNQRQQETKKFDEGATWRRHLGGAEHPDDFQIDTTGSNLLMNFNAAPTTTTTSTTSNGEQAKNDTKPAATTSANKPVPSTSSNNTNTTQAPKKKPPIIIVPSALSSLVTLYNVKDFLEKGAFVSTEDKKKVKPNKDKTVLVRYKENNRVLQEYYVIDTPEKMPKEDWKRVVAIFTNGQTWQFKGWETENATTLFTKYKGFHVTFDDQEVNANVKNWPVKVLRIGRADIKRHMDNTVVREFWQTLHG